MMLNVLYIFQTGLLDIDDMGQWDDVKTDFGGDETVNFGPRKEAGSALYQIDTVATVSCHDVVISLL